MIHDNNFLDKETLKLECWNLKPESSHRILCPNGIMVIDDEIFNCFTFHGIMKDKKNHGYYYYSSISVPFLYPVALGSVQRVQQSHLKPQTKNVRLVSSAEVQPDHSHTTSQDAHAAVRHGTHTQTSSRLVGQEQDVLYTHTYTQ